MQILQIIIKPQFLIHYKDWNQHAPDRQKKGLKLIGQILSQKGRKKIKDKTVGQMMHKLSSNRAISIDQAEQIMRKNQTTSTYQLTFGYLQSIPLNQLSVQMLSNWIQLNDQLQFQQLVLTTLRSLYSRYKAQQISTTQMKQQYIWKVDWDLAKPIRIDKAGGQLKAFKPNYQAILKQRVKHQKMIQRLKELQNSQYAQKLKIFKNFKIN